MGGGLAVAAVIGCGDDDDDGDEAVATGGGEEAPATADFALVSGWYRDQEVRYCDFGMNTPLLNGSAVATAPIWAVVSQ
jgi:hypothetical protein